jgi:DNA-binding protein HU-beta
MNKSELIKHIASQAGLTQTQATAALQAVETGGLKRTNGGEVTLVGTFKVS